MKIAMICDWFSPRLGGVEMHLHDLSRQLTGQGHEVRIITSTPGEAQDDGLPIHRLNSPRFPGYDGFAFTPAAFRRLKNILTQEHFDLVHTHISIVAPIGWAGAFQGVQLGLPTVATFHSRLNHCRPLLSMLNIGLGWSGWPVVFSAVSRTLADEFHSLVGPRTVHVLPNGVDPEFWRISHPPLDDRTIQIVSVMRLDKRKWAGPLIRMVPELLAALPPGRRLKLTIIGDGPHQPRIRRLIESLKLNDTVELLGRKPRTFIRDFFTRSHIFVLPSPLESFGLAALEARCAGLPVVARSQAGVSHFIQSGREGLLAGSDRELAECIQRLMLDADLRASIAAYNRRTPVSYGWSEVVPVHLETYRKALTNGGRPV